jgi:hypothetical protein
MEMFKKIKAEEYVLNKLLHHGSCPYETFFYNCLRFLKILTVAGGAIKQQAK